MPETSLSLFGGVCNVGGPLGRGLGRDGAPPTPALSVDTAASCLTDSQLSFAERGEGESGGEGGRQRDLPAQSCPETD